MTATGNAGPLAGVRVIEFTQVVAGPFAGVVLSDLGANVIKVEPLTGDPYRNTGTVVPDEGKRFQSLNRGKRSLAVDLHDERTRRLVQRLAITSDVVVINYREGVAQRLGIDYAALSAMNPGIIYCRITGFGVRGPHAARAATDPMMQAYSGLMMGDAKLSPDGLPASISASSISDYVTGLGGVAAICAALYSRRETGLGQLIDASLLRSALALQDTVVMREPNWDVVNRQPVVDAVEAARARDATYAEVLAARTETRSERSGARFYSGPYQAKDGVIMLGGLTPPSRAAARRVLGLPADDDTTLTGEAAAVHSRLIAATIRERTVAHWLAAFEAGGVPAAPVNVPELMADDPLVAVEQIMQPLIHEVTGPQRVVGPLFEMSATPTRARAASPPLGRHTVEVLEEIGMDPAEVAALRETGAVRAYGDPL